MISVKTHIPEKLNKKISLKAGVKDSSAFANKANDNPTAPLKPPWIKTINSAVVQPYPMVKIYFLNTKNDTNLAKQTIIYIPTIL